MPTKESIKDKVDKVAKKVKAVKDVKDVKGGKKDVKGVKDVKKVKNVDDANDVKDTISKPKPANKVQNVPTKTANLEFNYSDVYHGKTLDEWVQLVHKYASTKLKWKYFPLKKGAFGYDNFIMSLGYLFTKSSLKEYDDIELMAHFIHDGWAVNYIYWRDNEPWLSDDGYISPGKKLDDDRRNLCAKMNFVTLPEDEKEKDRIIAEFVVKNS
jgi:hypothetical protein